MRNIILGFLLGAITVMLIIQKIDLNKILTPEIIQLSFTVFLALLAGLIALYQVKANVISTARIKWIEEFKTNVSEYIASLNEAIFAMNIHRKSEEKEFEYYGKYFTAINRNHVFENKIRLNLNLKEDIYKKIDKDLDDIKEINEQFGIGNIDGENEEKMLIKFQSLAEHTSQAVKMEWEKSKKMFHSKWLHNRKNE